MEVFCCSVGQVHNSKIAGGEREGMCRPGVGGLLEQECAAKKRIHTVTSLQVLQIQFASSFQFLLPVSDFIILKIRAAHN